MEFVCYEVTSPIIATDVSIARGYRRIVCGGAVGGVSGGGGAAPPSPPAAAAAAAGAAPAATDVVRVTCSESKKRILSVRAMQVWEFIIHKDIKYVPLGVRVLRDTVRTEWRSGEAAAVAPRRTGAAPVHRRRGRCAASPPQRSLPLLLALRTRICTPLATFVCVRHARAHDAREIRIHRARSGAWGGGDATPRAVSSVVQRRCGAPPRTVAAGRFRRPPPPPGRRHRATRPTSHAARDLWREFGAIL